MSEYGLTDRGPNIKRLDTILDEMHTELSEKWGVNTRQNPQSYVASMLYNVADKLAELWEYAEDVYHSQYPSSAEGISLDNVGQLGGSTREVAEKSYYPIHCTGIDGTVLQSGTMISTATKPPVYLTITLDRKITRDSFNKALVKVASTAGSEIYTVTLNGDVYSYSTDSTNTNEILNGLKDAITAEDFTVSIAEVEEVKYLKIESNDKSESHRMMLSENLTTETVTSVITFGTQDTGDILFPDHTITEIVKADVGLLEIDNICPYIAGRDAETDTEFRQSYAAKIFNRSSRMIESIKSAILTGVQGVTACAGYENDTNEVDDLGRPPHSIEMVVDGGDSTLIAQKIWEKKAGGICTYGDVAVVLSGEYDEDITVNFSRPQPVYTWYRVGITLNPNDPLPSNYIDIVRGVIVQYMESLAAGQDVIPQQFISTLHTSCPGIAYADVTMFTTLDKTETPEEYTERSRNVTARQRAYSTEDMIEVDIDG